MRQGEVLISIEVLTEVEALAKPAGPGRSAPNMHPELPPPTGRIKLVRLTWWWWWWWWCRMW